MRLQEGESVYDEEAGVRGDLRTRRQSVTGGIKQKDTSVRASAAGEARGTDRARGYVEGHTRLVRRSVQGEVDTAGMVCVSTMGGMRLQSRYARVMPSKNASGSSVLSDGVGMVGSASTRACMTMYSSGTTPESMKEGGVPRKGAV